VKPSIVWVVYGEKATDVCKRSRESVSIWNSLPQQVVTGDIGAVSNKIASRHSKTTLLKRIKTDRALYLDADTLVRQAIDVGFEMLADGWDVVMVPSSNQGDDLMWHIGEQERRVTLGEMGYQPLQLQCGVMFIARNERTMAFWDVWHEEWMRWYDEDQAAFLRALKRVPLKIWLLGYPWNGGAVIEHRFGACRES
jgi:hypothetical protein